MTARQHYEVLFERHGQNPILSAADWPWFEDEVTYCNARLPQALIVSGAAMARARSERSASQVSARIRRK